MRNSGGHYFLAVYILSQEIADLSQQCLLSRRGRGGRRSRFLFFLELDYHAERDENTKGDNDEVDDILNEQTVVDCYLLY